MGGRWIHNTVKLPGVKVGVSHHLFRSVLQPSSNKSPNGSSSPACTVTANLVLAKIGPRTHFYKQKMVQGPVFASKKWSYPSNFGPSVWTKILQNLVP